MRTRRLQSLLLTLSMLAALVAVGTGIANAAPVQGTASVTVDGNGAREVIAGTQKLLTFTINNTGAPGGLLEGGDAAITGVRIFPRTANPADYTIVNGTATNPWVYQTTTQGRAQFTGGSIAPGSNAQFTVAANAVRPAADKATEWVVQVSDDGADFANPVQQLPSSPGALTTTIKVLALDLVAPSAPAGVLDNTATAAQDNVKISTTVHNYGSAALAVTPTLTSTQAADSIGTPTPASATIPAGDSQTFVFPVTMADAANNRTFTGDASATGANAIDYTSGNLTTQAKAQFSYVANTLSPVAAPSGVSKVFSLTLAKTNIPSVDLDTNSILTFTKGSTSFSTNLASVTSTGQNAQSVALTFAPIVIPGTPSGDLDGDYNGSLVLSGVDDNGASVLRNVTTDAFTIDNLMPFVIATLSAPNNQVDYETGAPVVKDGNTLTFGGTIKESSAEGAALDPRAVITECKLVVRDANGVPVSSTDVPLTTCKNQGGNITGSAALPTTGLPAGQVVLSLLVSDAAGNATPAPQVSNIVLIDNELPTPATAFTGCGKGAAAGCENARTIRVFLNEPVKGTFAAADFTVDDQTVVAAESACTAATACDKVTLTLAPPGIGPDDTPTVTLMYKEVMTVRPRPNDGAINLIKTPVAVDSFDGILPPLPSLDTVSQKALDNNGNEVPESYGKQGSDNFYYSNLNSPTFGIGGLTTGYNGIVARDSNGNGQYDGGVDQLIANCAATDSSAACAATTPLAAGTYAILVTATDLDGNLAEDDDGNNAVAETLVIDQTAPLSASFTQAASSVTVDFNEALARGRNNGGDWDAFERKDGQDHIFTVGGVSGSGAQRTLSVADSAFAGVVSGVVYHYEGQPANRYRDYAGNYLLSFTRSL